MAPKQAVLQCYDSAYEPDGEPPHSSGTRYDNVYYLRLLTKFKHHYGHTRVTQSHREWGKLWRWVRSLSLAACLGAIGTWPRERLSLGLARF